MTLADFTSLDPTTRWMIVIATGLTIAYAVMRPLKKKKDPLERQPFGASSLAQQRGLEREMSNLLVELSEMARQITSQLDTRAAKLELLIKEADQKIAMLSHSTPERRSLEDFSARVIERVAPPTPLVDPRHAEVYALADAGRSPREIAHQLSRPDGEIELILALRVGV